MPDTSLLLMWTALPRGIDRTTTPAQCRLSVLLSPRVSVTGEAGASATLADVPDLLDWPARLTGFQFTVEAESSPGTGPVAVPAVVVARPTDSALWQALLPGTTLVQDRVFDQDNLHDRPMQTYGHAQVTSALKNGYTGAFSSSPVAPPGHPMLAEAFPALAVGAGPSTPLLSRAEVAALGADAARAQQQAVAADLVAHARAGTLTDAIRHALVLSAHLTQVTGNRPGPLFPGTGTEAGEVGRLMAFHAAVSGPAGPAAAAPGGFEPELHSVITLLHEHPELLSRLGLLIDLTVPAAELPQVGLSAATPGQLRVTVTPAAGAMQASTTHYSPWTAFVRDTDQVFTPYPAASGNPEVIAGLLNLALPEIFTLGQVDADGSVLKASLMAAQPPGNDGGLPAMRTTGPSLIRAEQATALQQRMTKAAQDQDAAFGAAPAPVTLFAEDLTRGFRIDIRDHADRVWRSLHEREATYSVPGLPGVTVREEGVVQPTGALGSADPEQPTSLYVHESLASWEGWSLSVQRPGQVIGDQGPASLPSTPQPGGVPLTCSFTVVPGSLPRLRFGHSYDVRARAVDLGGGGLDPAEADAAIQLLHEIGQPLPVLPAGDATFTFQRFEPVPSPVLVPREQATEGESAERLVIRSSRTENAGQLAARLNSLVAAVSPDTGIRYLGVCERHLVPPKASQQTAERAGLLDGLTPAAAYLVSSKDQGGLADPAVLDVSTGQEVPLADVADPFTGGTRSAVEIIPSGGSGYPVHHEAALLLPYLPDWLAAGAVLCDLPGLPAGHQADVAADGSLVVTKSSLTHDVLPALSPVSSVTTIPFTGTWPLLSSLRLQLADGNGPLAWDPAERVLSVQLPPGRTATVRLSSVLPAGAVDLLGQWQWLLEASTQPPGAAMAELAECGLTWPLTPFREITLVHACLQPRLDPAIITLAVTRTPGDTGAQLSGQLSLDASSTGKVDLAASWTEPADPADLGQAAGGTRTQHVLDTSLPPGPGTGQLSPGSGGAPDVLTLSGSGARHEFGDTRHRRATYSVTGSTRFAEYFPAGIDAGPTTATGATVTVDVPSSARPPAPRVREAVPMWRWDRPADPVQPRRRYGAGVRLLLEAPWFASGDGEQLAVVLLAAADYPPGDDLRPRVTHWGADPAFGAAALPGPPEPASFPAGGPAVDATLDDGQQVVLVPHAVRYDHDRQVYVCDIPVDPGAAYAPFVRLAVVRYQASSLPGLAVSAVVQVPFVQVLPERTVTLTAPVPGAPDTFTVRVDGVSYVRSGVLPRPVVEGDIVEVDNVSAMPNLVEVTVQERMPGTSDEAGWMGNQPAVSPSSAIGGDGWLDGAADAPLWIGPVILPATRSPGQFRILITEYELLDSDFYLAYTYGEQRPFDVPPFKPAFVIVHDYYRPGSRRLVFAEELII